MATYFNIMLSVRMGEVRPTHGPCWPIPKTWLKWIGGLPKTEDAGSNG